jgi:hypothetical protein
MHRDRSRTTSGRSAASAAALVSFVGVGLLASAPLPARGQPSAAQIVASGTDCRGGSTRRLKLGTTRLNLKATVTLPGATHRGVIALLGGAVLTIVDADDMSTTLAEIELPSTERFVAAGNSTRYDRAGTLTGRIRLRDEPRQADTVRIALKAKGSFTRGAAASLRTRVLLTGNDECVVTCAGACSGSGGNVITCDAGAAFEPPRESGYGQVLKPRARPYHDRSALCPLAIETTGPRCDFFIAEQCLLPYPSSTFLDVDASTPTGLRVHYDPTSLPSNIGGAHIDSTDWNTLDGFGPGPMIVALFPDTGRPIDLAASDVAFHTNIARSLDADHPTVLMKADTGERILHFAEMDVHTDVVGEKTLIIRPGVRLDDATRYIVAVRSLVDEAGTPILPRAAFTAFRDGIADEEVRAVCGEACADVVAARRPAMEDLLSRLSAGGVPRDNLVLAWDFTTASTEALTGWMVSIRDQAFSLGTPTFQVTNVDDGAGAGRNADIYARIEGTFDAPLFMTADAPGARLNLVAGVPTQNGFGSIPFVVDIPRIAVASQNPAAVPARATTWGHGLLGDRFQLGTLTPLASTYNFVIAAVDMQGMSNSDLLPSVLPMISDLSLFHRIPERLHQGFLNHLLLGRLMNDPVSGFGSHPAFQLGPGGTSVIDSSQVFYSGGSQGGIFGVAIMAITDEFERGFLAVPASNYSTLLQRSVDFVPFFALLNAAYTDPLDRILLYPLLQQLWDRAEPHAYLPHVLPGTLSDPPFPHEILVHMATYDSEVSNLATEIMVRSLGIAQLEPVHRSFFGIPETGAPLAGSAFVEIDPQRGTSRCHTPGDTDAGAACSTDLDCPGTGDPISRTTCASGVPPLGNAAPEFNNGAHGSTDVAAAGAQIDAFLRTGGAVEQFCADTCDPE